MGTRSTVKFFNHANQCICAVYQQYDGYIEGVGHELAEWLKEKTIVNGFSSSDNIECGKANGIVCLAAQYVANFKKAIGGFYMTTADDSQDYDYEVRFIDGELQIIVDNFKGTPQELLDYDGN